MKATRILLFLSPLLWFVPPLISKDDNLGLAMVMPAKYGSAADAQQRGRVRAIPAKGASGPFEASRPLRLWNLAPEWIR